MAITWNPRPHINHAWSETKTVYGKIALVVFYSLIWVGIVSSLWSDAFPRSQGNACWMDAYFEKNEKGAAVQLSLIRAMNVMVVGFLSYADVGGLQVKNVAMVFVFIAAICLCFIPLIPLGQEAGCGSTMMQMWVWPGWAFLALLFKMVDEKMADRGTAEENTSLTV